MKRARGFHEALTAHYADIASSSSAGDKTPEQVDDLSDSDQEDAPSASQRKASAPPPAKRVKGFADIDSERALVDEKLLSMKERGHAAACQIAEEFTRANETAIAKVVAYIPPLVDDPLYQKKMMAAFSFTVTFTTVTVPGQYELGALFAYPPVADAMETMGKLFSFQPLEGRSLSESKKQYAAFLTPKDGNPKYKKPVMIGAHKYDCIDETVCKFAVEVCPSAKKNLHLQCHLNVYYRFDGHFFHMDVDEIRNNFRENGYEHVYLHVEAVETPVYASEMYLEIPAKKKSQAYWEKMTANAALAESRAVQGPKGSFSTSKYVK